MKISSSIDTTTYSYNQNGALSLRIDSRDGMITGKEEFSYTMGGLLKKFVKYDTSGDSVTSCNTVTNDTNRWDWRYRYSPLGGREQKRLYYSPNGDSCGRAHLWEYYLRGAYGEQLAVYKGRQTAGSTSCQTGRRVIFTPQSYITNGGELVTRADGMKEYAVADHLGSTRAIIDQSGRIQHFNYKPFGDSLNSGSTARIGFIGNQRDDESRYFSLGARMYDPEIGRFLSPDPLLEMFPQHSSYHYAYNSPLIWKDPSGLKGEKEKGGDRMQETVTELLVDAWGMWWVTYEIVEDATPLQPNSRKEVERWGHYFSCGGGVTGSSPDIGGSRTGGGASGGYGKAKIDGLQDFCNTNDGKPDSKLNPGTSVLMNNIQQKMITDSYFQIQGPIKNLYDQVKSKFNGNDPNNIFYYIRKANFTSLDHSSDKQFANMVFTFKIFQLTGPSLVYHVAHELFHLYQFEFKIDHHQWFEQGDGYSDIPLHELEAVQFGNLSLFYYYSKSGEMDPYDKNTYLNYYLDGESKRYYIQPKFLFPNTFFPLSLFIRKIK